MHVILLMNGVFELHPSEKEGWKNGLQWIHQIYFSLFHFLLSFLSSVFLLFQLSSFFLFCCLLKLKYYNSVCVNGLNERCARGKKVELFAKRSSHVVWLARGNRTPLTVLLSFSMSIPSWLRNLLPMLMKVNFPILSASLPTNIFLISGLLLSDTRTAREACSASLFFSMNWAWNGEINHFLNFITMLIPHLTEAEAFKIFV